MEAVHQQAETAHHLEAHQQAAPPMLQHVGSFPAKLRDHTRLRMINQKDFSIATKKELQTALKLLKQQKRLMEKN